jgi:hypothetical protein
MSYSAVHQRAYNLVSRKGASVVFSRETNTYDATTDTSVPATTTISGAAVRDKGNPLTYEKLGLVQSEAPTLFFIPENFGDLPLPNDTATWGGIPYTAKDVLPVAPDGTVIGCYVVVAR